MMKLLRSTLLGLTLSPLIFVKNIMAVQILKAFTPSSNPQSGSKEDDATSGKGHHLNDESDGDDSQWGPNECAEIGGNVFDYVGDVSDESGKAHGKGACTFASGGKYKGQFQEGEMHGDL